MAAYLVVRILRISIPILREIAADNLGQKIHKNVKQICLWLRFIYTFFSYT
jgi:hypothetical protein